MTMTISGEEAGGREVTGLDLFKLGCLHKVLRTEHFW